MARDTKIKQSYADTEQTPKLTGRQYWCCKADGCHLVAVSDGLCTFHEELADSPARWGFVTALLNDANFRTVLKATRHVMRYGDLGEERKEQATQLMRKAYRSALALGVDREILSQKTDERDGEKERFEAMARRYFSAMHELVKKEALAHEITTRENPNLEDGVARKSFDSALDENVF